MFNLTPMVKNILLINVVVFLLSSLIEVDMVDILGLRYIHAESFKPYQFFSYMWMHGGFMHLFGNMLAVLVFGPMLERVWGPTRFLAFYLITGIGAGVLYGAINYYEIHQVQVAVENGSRYYNGLYDFIEKFAASPQNSRFIEESKSLANQIYSSQANIPMVGASGAVFGVLMAFGMLFPNTVLYLLFPPIPVKAKYLVMFYGAYEIYSEINRSVGDNVAHFAHLSGMLIAFIILKYWQQKSGDFY
jgi:membrane associated rhomboid family serine protease